MQIAAMLASVLSAAGAAQGSRPATAELRLELRPVASGLEIPVMLTAPTGDARLFVVEKSGRIRIIRNGTLLPRPFLDIATRVSTGSEQGLLGLAFHPKYGTNGVFVVNYTDNRGDTHISTFKVSTDPDRADPASERVVLAIDQPYSNHNGGHVTFGPDGMLYVGTGDGGSGGDPQHHGQDAGDLLGSVLRLEIRDNGTMSVPSDNPFAQRSGARPELWNLGLRNPWRFSFDRGTGDLYIGDVGQGDREEIDVSPAATGRGRGANYGWSVYEGTSCYGSRSACRPGDFVMPTIEFTHRDGCSVIGGYVYRGAAMPSLRGVYFYSDYCGGWVRSFRFAAGQATDQKSWPSLDTHGSVSSFGEDAAGELYVMTTGGKLWRITQVP